MEFKPAVLAQSDGVVKHAHGVDQTEGSAPIAPGSVPETRMLWRFAPNPHAHEKPRECYSLTTHGVRNAYWMGFRGEDPQESKTDL